MQNSSSDLLINSKYAIVSIDIYFRIGAQPGTDAPPNYIGRHIVLDREAESIKIDELENPQQMFMQSICVMNCKNTRRDRRRVAVFNDMRTHERAIASTSIICRLRVSALQNVL